MGVNVIIHADPRLIESEFSVFLLVFKFQLAKVLILRSPRIKQVYSFHRSGPIFKMQLI
jgi:hypothetical protein